MKKPWRPMSTAPMDGTMIIVSETPNGEHWNVYPAMYANLGGGDPRMGQKAEGCVRWWAVWGSRYSGEGGDCTLPVRFKPLACTPVCWMPFPEPEPESTLRRRLSQLFRTKKKAPEPVQ